LSVRTKLLNGKEVLLEKPHRNSIAAAESEFSGTPQGFPIAAAESEFSGTPQGFPIAAAESEFSGTPPAPKRGIF